MLLLIFTAINYEYCDHTAPLCSQLRIIVSSAANYEHWNIYRKVFCGSAKDRIGMFGRSASVG